MRKTYAYNSIIIGVLLGLLVYVSTENVILAVAACLAASVVGFIIIRLIENVLYKGVDKAADAVSKAWQKHKDNKDQ